MEKGFNIIEINAKGGKLLGEKGLTFQKQALREGHVLREINKILGKGINILEIGIEGWKLHRKHPQICA